MANEAADKSVFQNYNAFLANFDIRLHNDVVIRSNYYKYFHPKEAFITNGELNRDITKFVNSETGREETVARKYMVADEMDEDQNETCISFVYPYGCTLSTKGNAISLLTTGTVCLPSGATILALNKHKQGGIIVCGSH